MSKQNIDWFIDTYKNSLRDVTLCYLIKKESNEVLIAMKKRGFGVGKYNGVGGKLEKGETVEQAMLRETYEEIGVRPQSYEKVAEIAFYFGGTKPNPDFNQRVHVFISDSWEGNPSESEEMKPEWVKTNNIPLDLMWADDKYWLPEVLKGKHIEASFLFGDDNKVADMKISYKKSNNK
ncbi:MAG: 8-oxo-dGTP diphosphatase [Candidatus Marsarchaeota archaeon]|nr:8-oxo-dGTP diphosphatase [Candidatus Marsarchaeota archaeon]MCL5102056.1 8-oxo-dGTP diphosphatase [Candidatus Marsarchaeota archaeon]